MIQELFNRTLEIIGISQANTASGITPTGTQMFVYILVCAVFCIMIFLCIWAGQKISKYLITLGIELITSRIGEKWEKVLIRSRVPSRVSHFLMSIICTHIHPIIFPGEPILLKSAAILVSIYLPVALAGLLYAIVDSIMIYGSTSPKLKNLPIKGFSQAVKLLVTLIVAIWLISILAGKSPMYFMSGIGAVMAVILLVFRDTLLGLTAGIMISTNKLVMNGDWIEIPGKADGVVEEVSLTTVKVRNWDNTIASVPAYALISESFKNWRGMTESGGRRIKRAIKIDVETIHFASPEEIEHWGKIKILQPYLEKKLREIEETRHKTNDTETPPTHANARHLTNLGTFRAYCVEYLRSKRHELRQDMTLLVRQLDFDSTGLPLEIYVFTSNTNWVAYENIQSDIFDHLFAIISEFNLRPFQQPSGKNFEKITPTK